MNVSLTTQAVPAAPVTAGPRPAITSGKPSGRIAALDFTKGSLILIMVLYHWLNYFVGPTGYYYIYLRFLPPSFIFISGFLVSHIYLAKYQITDSKLPKRLLTRGAKLLGVFAALNVIIDLLMDGPHREQIMLAKLSPHVLWTTYVMGSFADGRSVAFFILLPISYLLILSALLCVACRIYRHAFHAAFAVSLVLLLAASVNGVESGNLEFLTTGLFGISTGYLPMHRIQYVLKHPYGLMLAYLGYIVAINFWGVTYPFQVVSVFLTLGLLYWLGTISGELRRIPRIIIRLGKYSLYGYIVQIAILQVMRRGLRLYTSNRWVAEGCFIAAVMFTIAAVEMLDEGRRRSPALNRLYAAVFL